MAETNKQDVCTPKILSKNKASRGRSNTLAYSLRDRSTKDGTATKSKTVLGEVQLTPGLGRHGRSVSKKTPLKRGLRVETGVCGETVPLRTPRKREKPRMKKIWYDWSQSVCCRPMLYENYTHSSFNIYTFSFISCSDHSSVLFPIICGCILYCNSA